MGNCCSSGSKKSSADTDCATNIPKTAYCPVDGQSCRSVELRTVLHHLKRPHANRPATQGYYFCDNKECDVVYFGQDGTVITRHDVRSEVGQKSSSPDRVICYCFGITEREVLGETDHQPGSSAKEFVIEQTRLHNCACDVRNPSGRCCLKDFPKAKPLPSQATGQDCDAAGTGGFRLTIQLLSGWLTEIFLGINWQSHEADNPSVSRWLERLLYRVICPWTF